MPQLTITEALAELKTIKARIEKKRALAGTLIGRQEAFKDPHEKDGGSRVVYDRETQAVVDLEERTIRIRDAIQKANQNNVITVADKSRTIHDWLCWRRDVAPGRKEFLAKVQRAALGMRNEAQKHGFAVNVKEDAKPSDVIIHVDELAIAAEIEKMEEILGTLDGQLSLKNATITIEVA